MMTIEYMMCGYWLSWSQYVVNDQQPSAQSEHVREGSSSSDLWSSLLLAWLYGRLFVWTLTQHHAAACSHHNGSVLGPVGLLPKFSNVVCTRPTGCLSADLVPVSFFKHQTSLKITTRNKRQCTVCMPILYCAMYTDITLVCRIISFLEEKWLCYTVRAKNHEIHGLKFGTNQWCHLVEYRRS